LLAAWLSLQIQTMAAMKNQKCHDAYRVWDSLSGFLKSITYIQYHSMQLDSSIPNYSK
jgi:hypothetical protein